MRAVASKSKYSDKKSKRKSGEILNCVVLLNPLDKKKY